jgi:hypothetical protein
VEAGLLFGVIYGDIDLLKVRISAWNGCYGGVADVYVAIGELQNVASKLEGFPQHPNDVREHAFGEFGRSSAGGAARIRCYCVDRAGHAYIESKMESEYETGGVVQSVVLSMGIEANAVDSFIVGLRRLETDGSGIAFLKGAALE